MGVLLKQSAPPRDSTLGPAYYNPLLVRTDTHVHTHSCRSLNVHPSENVKCSFVHACVLSLVCTSVCLSVLTLPARRGPLVLGRSNAPLHPPTPPHSVGPKPISIANECGSTLKKPQRTNAHPFYMPTKRAISNYSSSYITIFT